MNTLPDRSPHPDLPLGCVLHGDCIEMLATLPEKSVDLIFADPPYNLQLQNDLWRPNMTKVDAVDDDWDRFDNLAAYDAFTGLAGRMPPRAEGHRHAVGHRLVPQHLPRGHGPHGPRLLDSERCRLDQDQPDAELQGTRFTNAHETLIWAQKKRGEKYTFNYHSMKALNGGKQMRSDWEDPAVYRRGTAAHQREKGTRRRSPRRCCTASSCQARTPAMSCSTRSSARAQQAPLPASCIATGSASRRTRHTCGWQRSASLPYSRSLTAWRPSSSRPAPPAARAVPPDRRDGAAAARPAPVLPEPRRHGGADRHGPDPSR